MVLHLVQLDELALKFALFAHSDHKPRDYPDSHQNQEGKSVRQYAPLLRRDYGQRKNERGNGQHYGTKGPHQKPAHEVALPLDLDAASLQARGQTCVVGYHDRPHPPVQEIQSGKAPGGGDYARRLQHLSQRREFLKTVGAEDGCSERASYGLNQLSASPRAKLARPLSNQFRDNRRCLRWLIQPYFSCAVFGRISLHLLLPRPVVVEIAWQGCS